MPEFSALRRAGQSGDLAAIDCLIARYDTLVLLSGGDEVWLGYQIAWRYIRWIETGNLPPDLFELAARIKRSEFQHHIFLHYLPYVEAAGMSGIGFHRLEDHCILRPPKMDRIWRAAQPDEGSKQCDDAVIDHPTY
ncbi:MAG: hypothetical protein AAFX09_05200 [Pseudomonadota bacterium]